MAASRVNIPDSWRIRRLTAHLQHAFSRSFEDLDPPKEDDSSDLPPIKERLPGTHDGSVKSFFSLAFDITLILSSLVFFAFGVAAVYLNGKPVSLNPFGNLLIEATKPVFISSEK
jgi:hypothetical protein